MKKTKQYRTALLSMVIGDGGIQKGGYLEILHCEAQKEYLLWKYNYLKSLGVNVSEVVYKNNNGFPAYRFTVKPCAFTKLLRRILYIPTKNYFNRKLLNRLSSVHIAIWYMDDGGLSQKKRNGKVIANELMLNTHTTKENNQILIDYFLEVWGVQFKQYRNRGHYRLACGTKEARKFIDIVKPYVETIKCMEHKLSVKTLF